MNGFADRGARRCSAGSTLITIVSLCLAIGLGGVLGAPAAYAQPGTDDPALPSLERMGPPPVGANDFSCTPSEAHPRPVVLVHGTDTDMQESWPTLSPELASQGYCVFALNYGAMPVIWDTSRLVWGVGDITRSAIELDQFVNAVLSSTGADQVDLIGHSQGGTLARQYLKFNGGADVDDPARNKVANVITLGATNHGTNFAGLQQLYLLGLSLGLPRDLTSQFIFGTAGTQQLVGSPLLKQLNSGSEVMPGVEYTVIATRNDGVVTPPERTFLDDEGSGQVTNMWVQDICPANRASHMGLTSDPDVAYMISSALDPTYADTHPLRCGA